MIEVKFKSNYFLEGVTMASVLINGDDKLGQSIIGNGTFSYIFTEKS